MRELPLQTQTVFAELADRAEALEASRTIASLRGSFASKQVKGHTYWYFKTSQPGRGQVEIYLGAASPALERVRKAHRQGLPELREEESRLRELVAMLRAGRGSLLDRRSGRVLRSLADAGIFRLGGVLVGTQAFVVLGNMLGVRWSSGTRTEDIDLAATKLPIVLADLPPTDLPTALESLEMGFLPVPGLDPRHPSTSFKVRGRGLRVDLLTPLRGRDRTGPVEISRWKTAAQPLRFLDFLVEDAIGTAAVDGGAVWVQVPRPARFAVHKLLVSSRRNAGQQTRANKDRLQASELLDLLVDARPGEVESAIEDLLTSHPRIGRQLRANAGRLAAGPGRDTVLDSFPR